MERPAGSNDLPPGYKPMDAEPTPSSSASSSKPAPPPSTFSSEPEKPKAEEVQAEAMEVDEPADDAQKKEAEDLKAKGNAAYKARRFEEAIGLYDKAWETYPKDVTFLTNLSGECPPHQPIWLSSD